MSALRLIFMGTPDFALAPLKALTNSNHEIIAVYTQPPRAAGRGMGVKKSPVHGYAEEQGFPVLVPKNFKAQGDIKAFQDLNPDLAVVAAYGLLLPETILSAPRLGCINIHASLLPRWRGASPIQQVILHGDEKSGISIMQMEKGLDTGPVLAQESFPLDARETAGTLHDKLVELAGRIIVPAVDGLASGELKPEAQDDTKATLAPKIRKEEGEVDWTVNAEAIDRKVRAFHPAPGAWFTVNGKRIRILEGKVMEGSAEPGEVMDDRFTIGCGEGAYQVIRLQREGKTEMTADEFLHGTPVPSGTKLDQ